MSRLFAALGLFCLLFAAALPARAEEVFTSYRSEIALARDGTLDVTETIRANVEGVEIKRGIYRDFPLTFLDANGRKSKVDFKLVSVMRDGEEEPYRTESISGGIRVYTGDADVFLPAGEHTFQFSYETSRQIRFFDDHDELYWNVTGTEWDFPIEEAVAEVTLPAGVTAKALDVFTGSYGATDKNARALQDGDRLVFTTTQRLERHEGLTIAVMMPAGSIDTPSETQQRLWWFRDHLAPLIAVAGLVIVALYYMVTWSRVGRDPARGVIVPRWDAPDGISPALVNYIDNKGFSGEGWTALSAAALNLAVSGRIVLEDLKSSLVMRATGSGATATLPAGEQTLMREIERNGGTLTVDKANGPTVQTVGKAFRAAMEREHRNKYYLANSGYIWGGILISVLFLVAIFVFGGLDETNIALVIVPVGACIVLSFVAVGIGKSLFRRGSLFARIKAIVAAAFFGFMLISGAFSIGTFIITAALESHELPLLLAVGGIVLVNIVFFLLMGAPTPLGTKMMDGIDGLRQYLTLAEKDRMNMAGAPVMSPRHFETLLPYAVALGLEKPWARTFDRWLLTAAAAAAAYQPAWYHGTGFGAGSFGDRMGGFAGSVADTMVSSLPPPPRSSSSGSGGGGFSGGGGGGGGGGGW